MPHLTPMIPDRIDNGLHFPDTADTRGARIGSYLGTVGIGTEVDADTDNGGAPVWGVERKREKRSERIYEDRNTQNKNKLEYKLGIRMLFSITCTLFYGRISYSLYVTHSTDSHNSYECHQVVRVGGRTETCCTLEISPVDWWVDWKVMTRWILQACRNVLAWMARLGVWIYRFVVRKLWGVHAIVGKEEQSISEPIKCHINEVSKVLLVNVETTQDGSIVPGTVFFPLATESSLGGTPASNKSTPRSMRTVIPSVSNLPFNAASLSDANLSLKKVAKKRQSPGAGKDMLLQLASSIKKRRHRISNHQFDQPEKMVLSKKQSSLPEMQLSDHLVNTPAGEIEQNANLLPTLESDIVKSSHLDVPLTEGTSQNSNHPSRIPKMFMSVMSPIIESPSPAQCKQSEIETGIFKVIYFLYLL